MHIIQHRRSWSDYGTRQIPLNPLNAELIPICHLLVLLGVYPFLHISRIRVFLARTVPNLAKVISFIVGRVAQSV